MTPEQTKWVDGLLRLKAVETPAALHREFEAELGYINSHLCIADAALRDFQTTSKTDTGFVYRRVRTNGHRRLNVAVLQIDDVLELSYTSHIALFLGRMAHLCARVQSHPLINRKLNEHAKGDYFRKALWVVLQSQSEHQLPTPLDKATLNQHVPESATSMFDRFREMRNTHFHSVTPSFGDSVTRFPEVLACSKALQQMSRHLCRALAGTAEMIAIALAKRCGNLHGDRRRHAARAILEQEYLLDGADVQGILFDLAW
jgi:hypothetical protein